MDQAHEIINQIMRNPDDSNIGVLANELVGEFHRGYPIQHLRQLLAHRDDNVVATGIWVASELGEKVRSLLGDVVPLLKHPAKNVRFFAIECVLSCATPSNRVEIASVVPMLDDAEPAVRWKAMGFLSRASREQLHGSLDYLYTTGTDSPHTRGLKWLLSDDAGKPEEVTSLMQSQDALLRKYGVVAAVRLSRRNRGPLLSASSIADPDIKQFAADMLKSSECR